jgi:hypothetical protein
MHIIHQTAVSQTTLPAKRHLLSSPELWFKYDLNASRVEPAELGRSAADRLEHLFETIRNPSTGKSYTNIEVARMSAGGLKKEDVEGIRTGAISDPTVSQVAAAFGVPPSFLLDRDKEPSVLDEEVLEALEDETAGAILRESARLPEREKEIVLGIVRQFSRQLDEADAR